MIAVYNIYYLKFYLWTLELSGTKSSDDQPDDGDDETVTDAHGRTKHDTVDDQLEHGGGSKAKSDTDDHDQHKPDDGDQHKPDNGDQLKPDDGDQHRHDSSEDHPKADDDDSKFNLLLHN